MIIHLAELLRARFDFFILAFSPVRELNEVGETVFVALYSAHTHDHITYMNIALPLPFSNMTGILKPKAEDGCLILTSSDKRSDRGDEGIFLSKEVDLSSLPWETSWYKPDNMTQ